jgi:uncharacterized protein YjbI with pentapeptide repeats
MKLYRLNGELIGEGDSRKSMAERSRKNLQDADLQDADLQDADLQDADLRDADLQDADLRDADLRGADLQGAYLRGAYLRCADLRDADLRGADLQDAAGYNKYLIQPLFMMLYQKTIVGFKIVNEKGEGIYNGGLKYIIGETVEVNVYDSNEHNNCGAGINLATLSWVLNNNNPDHRILLCEHTPDDIVAIPITSDGKYRVKKCKVIGEWKNPDDKEV